MLGSDDGLSLWPSLRPLLGITECNDDGTVNGESDIIFDGTLLGPELGTVAGTPFGSNDRLNPDIPLGTSKGTVETDDGLLDSDLVGILLTVSLVLLMVKFLDLMMAYHLDHH